MTTEQIIISPPKPHSDKQALIMQAFLHPQIKEIWVAAATKFGKSISASSGQSNYSISHPGTKHRWIAPLYLQAAIGYDYTLQIMPPEPIVKPTRNNLVIHIPDLGNRHQFLHSQKPTDLEGDAINSYIFDECAKMANLEEVYSSARSTRTMTRGPMGFFSTPFGKNEFYKRCMEAREVMIAAQKKGEIPEKIFITAKTEDNPFISREEIERAKRDLPSRLYRQLYLAEFVDEADVFSGFRDCYWTPPLHLGEQRQFWVADDAKECEVVIGADWAKTHDWTTLFAGDIRTKKIIGLQRFHKIPYTEQIRMLCQFASEFGDVRDIWHDKTGLGHVIDDLLAHTGLPYRGIIFSNASKAEMVNQLITGIERKGKDIQIPRWSVLESEMDAYQVVTNKLGSMSYGHPPGGHDDTVSALMLCNAALNHYEEREYSIRYLEDLGSEENHRPAPGSLEEYYSDLMDED